MGNEKGLSTHEIALIFIFGLILIILIIFALRDNIFHLIIWFIKVDLYIGDMLSNIGLFTKSEAYKDLMFQMQTYKFDWNSFKLLFSKDNIKFYDLGTHIFNYFLILNIFIFGLIVSLENYLLDSINKLKNTKQNFEKKNESMQLYFCDKELDFKRKTIKMGGKNVFAFRDYYLPYLDDNSEPFIERYIEQSIEVSYSRMNKDLKLFQEAQKVWESIVDEHKINGELPIIKKYQFKRFELIDKFLIKDKIEEFFIFKTTKNEYSNVNLWTSKNSNKIIRQYILKFHPDIDVNTKDETDFTAILLKDLELYFIVKNFRAFKTFYFDKKDANHIKTPLLLTKEIKENISNEELKKLQKENYENTELAKKYYSNLKYLKFYIESPFNLKFSQPLIPRLYVLTPKRQKFINFIINKKDKRTGKTLEKEVSCLGLEIPVKILNYYIRENYVKEIKEQIKQLEKDGPDENRALIEELKSRISQDDTDSRVAKIKEILEQHQFEETFVISYWQYGLKLLNLPTGRLAKIKKDNLPFWYAFTAIGRPFVYKAGLPIEVIRRMEVEFNTALNKLKRNTETKTTEEIIGKDHFNKIKEQTFEDLE